MTQQDTDRYLIAAHAMQSGVKMMMNYTHPEAQTADDAIDPDTGPKHLRVGVNTAMSDHGALVMLLIDKGIITRDDYDAAIADSMEREVHNYEKEIEKAIFQKTGNRTKITLQ